MILKLLVPPQESYEVDGTNGYQLVVCLVEDAEMNMSVYLIKQEALIMFSKSLILKQF